MLKEYIHYRAGSEAAYNECTDLSNLNRSACMICPDFTQPMGDGSIVFHIPSLSWCIQYSGKLRREFQFGEFGAKR